MFKWIWRRPSSSTWRTELINPQGISRPRWRTAPRCGPPPLCKMFAIHMPFLLSEGWYADGRSRAPEATGYRGNVKSYPSRIDRIQEAITETYSLWARCQSCLKRRSSAQLTAFSIYCFFNGKHRNISARGRFSFESASRRWARFFPDRRSWRL